MCMYASALECTYKCMCVLTYLEARGQFWLLFHCHHFWFLFGFVFKLEVMKKLVIFFTNLSAINNPQFASGHKSK